MFSLTRRFWNSQLFSILILLPSRFLNRVLGTIQLFLGVQRKLSDPAVESNPPARVEIQVQATKTTSGRLPELKEYHPPVEEIIGHGSTCIVGRVKPGIVLKYPRYSWKDHSISEVHKFVQDIKHSFNVEIQILGILKQHANIINFLGYSEDPLGLLFTEANRGNLQEYLDYHNDTIDDRLRMKWRMQAADAIQHLHQNKVIHSDLRPANFLLHTDDNGLLDLYLSDFGGSTCGDIDGGHLPDSGFFDPRKPWVSTEDTDIFSLGSVFYTIMTGHWPYRLPGPFVSMDDKVQYEERVDALFSQGRFPTVEGLPAGIVIRGCWTGQYKDVQAMQNDQNAMIWEFSR